MPAQCPPKDNSGSSSWFRFQFPFPFCPAPWLIFKDSNTRALGGFKVYLGVRRQQPRDQSCTSRVPLPPSQAIFLVSTLFFSLWNFLSDDTATSTVTSAMVPVPVPVPVPVLGHAHASSFVKAGIYLYPMSTATANAAAGHRSVFNLSRLSPFPIAPSHTAATSKYTTREIDRWTPKLRWPVSWTLPPARSAAGPWCRRRCSPSAYSKLWRRSRSSSPPRLRRAFLPTTARRSSSSCITASLWLGWSSARRRPLLPSGSHVGWTAGMALAWRCSALRRSRWSPCLGYSSASSCSKSSLRRTPLICMCCQCWDCWYLYDCTQTFQLCLYETCTRFTQVVAHYLSVICMYARRQEIHLSNFVFFPTWGKIDFSFTVLWICDDCSR